MEGYINNQTAKPSNRDLEKLVEQMLNPEELQKKNSFQQPERFPFLCIPELIVL